MEEMEKEIGLRDHCLFWVEFMLGLDNSTEEHSPLSKGTSKDSY